MNFDLDRLGPREFEHLVQSLCAAELGNGVEVFGDGPDGGREATFDGKVDFPIGCGQTPWNGYGVIQAKYRLHPESPSSNLDWLNGNISDEFKQWKPGADGSPPKRKRVPKYYLMATNVRLSGVEARGGIDQATLNLRTLAEPLRIKDVVLWHFDSICNLLRKHAGIRKTFSGFILAADVLESMQGILDAGPMLDVAKSLRIHAGEEIVNKRWVRLGDASYDNDTKLRLSDVAVDLPGTLTNVSQENVRQNIKVAEYVVRQGDHVLRQSFRAAGDCCGVAVVGGPGQGKSTLAQIIAQAYRLELVGELPKLSLGVEADEAAARIRRRFGDIALPRPAHRRWPIYVALSDLGRAIGGDIDPSLLRYMASQVNVAGEPLNPRELNKWLKTWPCAIILDGFDEVPSPYARAKIMSAVSKFMITVNVEDYDAFVIATTRPQGYNNEFAAHHLQVVELCDLTALEAVSYASDVINVRYRDDPEAKDDVLQRAKEASEEPTTSRLMRSPLQVTIMTYLLAQQAKAPKTRYGLFETYYETIYQREAAKAGFLGELLARHRDDVDAIHQNVALQLQVSAEVDDKTESGLSWSLLENVIRERLVEVGHESPSLQALCKDIQEVATHRLVLLAPVEVAGEAGYVGYDVRSLQEFMAARALTTGADDEVLTRLENLASSVHWRNTWLLAAGRIFSRSSQPHLRDRLLYLLRRLDSQGATSHLLGHGERIAIELLDDNVASAPKDQRELIAHALCMLQRWPGSDLHRFADVLRRCDFPESAIAEIIRPRVTAALSSGKRDQLSAVVLLKAWNEGRNPFRTLSRQLLAKFEKAIGEANRCLGKFERMSIFTILNMHIDASHMSTNDRGETLRAMRALESYKGPAVSSVNSLCRHSQARTNIKQATLACSGFRNLKALEAIAQAIDELDISNVAAAMWLCQLILSIDERAIVGDTVR